MRHQRKNILNYIKKPDGGKQSVFDLEMGLFFFYKWKQRRAKLKIISDNYLKCLRHKQEKQTI